VIRHTAVNFKAKDSRYVDLRGPRHGELGIGLEQQMRERGAKVRAIDVGMPTVLGEVDVLTFGAEDLGRVGARHVTLPDRQHGLAVAQHTRTAAKVNLIVLLDHEGETA